MNKEPLITIYMPTHNRVKLLKRAIQSVIAQSYQNWELIIVDDGSSDNTPEYLADIASAEKRIRWLRHETPKGACQARNSAINMANGKFITGLDDDDEFTKDRLSNFLNNWDPKYSFICCNFYNVDKMDGKSKHFRTSGEYNLTNVLINNEAGNQIFTLLSRFKEISGFTNDLKKLQDWDCWIRLCAKFGSFKRFSDITYHMHHGHETPRVSNNQSYPNALIELIKNNKLLYDNRSLDLLKNYLINRKINKALLDLLKSRNFDEAYFIIVNTLKIFFKKV